MNDSLLAGQETFQSKKGEFVQSLLWGPSYPQHLFKLTKDYYFLSSSSRPQLNQPHP